MPDKANGEQIEKLPKRGAKAKAKSVYYVMPFTSVTEPEQALLATTSTAFIGIALEHEVAHVLRSEHLTVPKKGRPPGIKNKPKT